MNFELDPAYQSIQAQARELARAVEPFAAEADEMSVVHPGVRAALQQSGLSALMVPKAYGGRAERPDPLAICLVREVLMGTSSHLDSLFALQGIGSYAISVGGSEAQRERWLPRVARTDFTGTERSTSAMMAATISPPWLTSATSLSASKSW